MTARECFFETQAGGGSGVSGGAGVSGAGSPGPASSVRPEVSQGADSLSGVAVAGTGARFPADTVDMPGVADSAGFAGVVDTVGGLAGDESVGEEMPWREVPVEAVFGEASTLVAGRPYDAGQLRAAVSPVTADPVFQGLVLVLAALYCMLIYRSLGDIRRLLTRVSRDTPMSERLFDEPGHNGLFCFPNRATVIGLLFLGVVAVRFGASRFPLPGDFPGIGALASLLATLACVALVVFQAAVVSAVGAVTLSQPLMGQLLQFKRTYFSLAVILAVPPLLLLVLAPPGTGALWIVAAIVLSAVPFLLYLIESLRLFISKKVSILHWFLYLCTVEIFPISLLYLLAAR